MAEQKVGFWGGRIPREVVSMAKHLKDLDKKLFRQILKVVVNALEEKECSVSMTDIIDNNSLSEEKLSYVVSGMYELLKEAFRQTTSSMKQEIIYNVTLQQDVFLGKRKNKNAQFGNNIQSNGSSGFEEDLRELRISEDFIGDFSHVVFGNGRPALNACVAQHGPRLPKLEKLRWRVDVAISTSSLSRALQPSILMQLQLSDRNLQFEVPMSKFQQLRYNVTLILKEMNDLEKRSVLKIQDYQGIFFHHQEMGRALQMISYTNKSYLSKCSRSRMIRPAPIDVKQSWITWSSIWLQLPTGTEQHWTALHRASGLFTWLWKMKSDYGRIHGLTWTWFVFWIIQSQIYSVSSIIFWTAYVEVFYVNPESNQMERSMCECGVYGLESPLIQASGLVVLPNSDSLACQPNTTFNIKQEPWIALIKRGNCTYAKKIQAAEQAGALAVVIYNIDGTGNRTDTMPHSGAEDIVAIMIGNNLGGYIKHQIERGSDVYMNITVANRHSPFNPFWIYIMSFIFFGITAIILGYFIFVVISRFYQNRQLRIQQRKIQKVAEKAVAKLDVRTLRRTDPEVEAEENSCVVCLDAFMRCDVVTTLPCSHIFHKTCIEPWLLEHHTCPMCKYDILIEEAAVKPSPESPLPPTDVRFYPSSVSGFLAHAPRRVTSPEYQGDPESFNTPTTESAEGQNSTQMDHIYMNPAFEEEHQIADVQDPGCFSHQD